MNLGFIGELFQIIGDFFSRLGRLFEKYDTAARNYSYSSNYSYSF